MQCIEAREILKHSPVINPLPTFYFNQILQIGKANNFDGNSGNDIDESSSTPLK